MAGIPPPPRMKTTGNPLKNFKLFRRNWENYEIATKRNVEPNAVRIATLQLAMGEKCLRVYDTLTFTEDQEDQEGRIDSILNALEEHFVAQDNASSEPGAESDLQESDLMLARVINIDKDDGSIACGGTRRPTLVFVPELPENHNLVGMYFSIRGNVEIEGPISDIRSVIKAMIPVIVLDATHKSPMPVPLNAQAFIAHELQKTLRFEPTNYASIVHKINYEQQFDLDMDRYTEHALVPKDFPKFYKSVSQKLTLAISALGAVKFQYNFRLTITTSILYNEEERRYPKYQGRFVDPLCWDEHIIKVINNLGKCSKFSVNTAAKHSWEIMRMIAARFLQATEEQDD